MAKKGLGWVPDYPDIRDYSLESQQIQALNGDSDRADDKINRLTRILSSLQSTLSNEQQKQLGDLAELSKQIQQEMERKVVFRSANLACGVLTEGATGKAVQDLQEKLIKLGYLPSQHECSAYYDSETQVAVKKFQIAQKLEATGIASAVTLAQLSALAAIADQAAPYPYLAFGDRGPAVIFLQQQLLTLKQQNLLGIDGISLDELRAGEFGTTTFEAVKAFQKVEFPTDQRQWDGIVGKNTGTKLKARFQTELLQYLTAPIAQTHFDQIVDLFLDQFIQKESISDSKATLYQHLFLDNNLYPVVEVIAQLIPFLQGYDKALATQYIKSINDPAIATGDRSEQGKAELKKALSISYGVIRNCLPDQPTSSTALIEQFVAFAVKLTRRRGYISSRALGDRNARMGDTGAAIIYLQERLRDLGYYNAPTTGYFEQLTANAVEELLRHVQENTGLIDALKKLDTEIFRPLEPSIPEIFFTVITDKIWPVVCKAQAPPDVKAVASPWRSLVMLLMQMVMPAGKQDDLEQAIQDGFGTLQAIAQYSLIKQAILQTLNLKEEQSKRPLSQWLSVFQDFTLSESAQQISQVMGDRPLLDQFEAPIVAMVRALPPKHDILTLLYQGLKEEIEELWETTVKTESKQASISTGFGEPSVSNIKSPYLPSISLLIERIRALIDQMLECPNSLESIPSRQTKEQTFVQINQAMKGCLQVPIHAKLSQELNIAQAQTGCVYLVLPDFVDLSFWCSPIEDQGGLNACTAHAGVALIEYFERKSFGVYIDASRRFLYKVARNLMQQTGDSGASVRETIKAMVLFGVPPEEYCPYDEADFDTEPESFCYAYAQNYQAINYFRLDNSVLQSRELLAQIKLVLVAGFPCMFGFTVYDSIHTAANTKGHIPYPTKDSKREGGHAAVAVGYDDSKQVKNAPHPGAFLIRNSWGVDWGDRGYGWLPYDYVLSGLARDWWSLIKTEWVETGSFGLGSSLDWNALGEKGNTLLPPKKT